MPTPRTWLPRLQEILGVLRASNLKVFDRPAVEHLFQLHRRMALLLIKEVGAEKLNCMHVVQRKALIQWVEKIETTEGREYERRQHMRAQLAEEMIEFNAARHALRDAGKPAVQFPLTREILEATVDSLSSEIQISPGRITIDFDKDDPVQACQMLYALSLVLANDYDSFAALMTARQSHVA